MERIIVSISLAFDQSKGNFEEIRKKEGAQLLKWREDGILEHVFIRSDKGGAVLIFMGISRDEVIEKVESLPLFPHMQEVGYLEFEKRF